MTILGTALPIGKAWAFTAHVGFVDLSHYETIQLVLFFRKIALSTMK